jgi:hypothetical protein
MTAMIVYRVENRDGEGPYRAFLPNEMYDWNHHPSPREDGIEFQEYHYFGFCSKEQLYKWFRYPWVNRTLNREGYRLVTYQVSKNYIILGENQLVFTKAEAQKRCAEPLTMRMCHVQRYLEQPYRLFAPFADRLEWLVHLSLQRVYRTKYRWRSFADSSLGLHWFNAYRQMSEQRAGT